MRPLQFECRFCRQLVHPTDGGSGKPASIPLSKAENVLSKLQQAAAMAASSGRPFLALCSLLDPAQKGKITSGEICTAAKMMNCALKPEEVNTLKDLLPDHALGDDGSVDYRELNWLLHNYRSHVTTKAAPVRSDGALPYYASPGHTTLIADNSRLFDLNNSIQTPSGYYIAAPGGGYQGAGGETKRDKASYDRMVSAMAARVKVAVEEKSRIWGTSFSLKRQFQIFDNEKSGWVPLKTFQSSLSDVGVELSAEELHAIRTQFGRGEDDKILYDEFCKAVLGPTADSRRSAPMGISRMDSFRLQDSVREAREIFHTYDRTKRGLVSGQQTCLHLVT